MSDKPSTAGTLFPTPQPQQDAAPAGDDAPRPAPGPDKKDATPAAADTPRGPRTAWLPFSGASGSRAPGSTLPDGTTILTREPEGGWALGDSYTLAGRITRVRYQSPDGFFAVASFQLDDGTAITLRGSLGQVQVDDRLRISGRWVSSKYGEQLEVNRCEPILPVTAEGIAKFLAGQLPGVGPRLALRIVDHFGPDDTIAVLDTTPERLAEVEGIGASKLERIIKEWRERHAQRAALIFLQSIGVPLGIAARIIRELGDETALIVRSDPYRLARDVRGIGFQWADRIAQSLGIPPDAPARIEAGVRHALHEAEGAEGHCFLTSQQLVPLAAQMLGVDIGPVEEAIARLCSRSALIAEPLAEGDAIFSPRCWRAEVAVATEALQLLAPLPQPPPPSRGGGFAASTASGEPNKKPPPTGAAAQPPEGGAQEDTSVLVSRIGNQLGIQLADAQRRAVELALGHGRLVVVTGGPGTGKTTLVRVLVEASRKRGWKVHLAAPTGRAAKRLAEATGAEARTIHRMLEFSFQHGGFQRNQEQPLPDGLYVIDETSMIDIFLMRALLEALPTNARLVLVGDVDQLPSVGPGMVLRDLIESGTVPLVRLTEVFRQEEASLIVKNAHRINSGQMPVLPRREPDDDSPVEYFALNVSSSKEAEQLVVELVCERLPKAFGLDPLEDIQVLCPMRVREAGADAINIALQAQLNPDGQTVGRRRARSGSDDDAGPSNDGAVRVGDRVMQLRNDYDKDIYNGDVGRVVRYLRTTRETVVDFDGRELRYSPDEMNDLTLAYACTVHKAQGSEYKAVVIPLLRSHFPMLQRNLVYTALTRARRLAIFVGQSSAMRIAVQNARPAARNTRLADRLR